jgi:leader peptidase (prepilin peptidase) / N-methyltransferase
MSPEIFHAVLRTFSFMVGACLGSFFNVVIHRLPAKESLAYPGSRCPRCRHAIAFYDNIPVLSYFLLRGKCRHCRSPISFRYPLVEALTGAMSLLLYNRYGLHAQFLIEFSFVAVLIVIAFIDFDTYTIPDVLSLPGIVAGLGLSFFSVRVTWIDSLLGTLLGGGCLYIIAYGYQRLRHQEGLGGGDIKLLGMIGAFVGLPGVVFTVLLASLVGSATGLFLMARSRKGLSTMVPFGPFLAFGAVCYLFWGADFFRWYLNEFAGS